jgi:hypothetical protein
VTIEDEICERYRHALKSWRFTGERAPVRLYRRAL